MTTDSDNTAVNFTPWSIGIVGSSGSGKPTLTTQLVPSVRAAGAGVRECVQADVHLTPRPRTSVAVVSALAHAIVTEGLAREDVVAEHCEWPTREEGKALIADPGHSPEATGAAAGVLAAELRGTARLVATGGNAAIDCGLGVTEYSRGRTTRGASW